MHFSKAGLAQCCWAGNLIVGDIWRHMVTSFPGWIWLKNRGIPQSLKGFDQSQTSHFVSTLYQFPSAQSSSHKHRDHQSSLLHPLQSCMVRIRSLLHAKPNTGHEGQHFNFQQKLMHCRIALIAFPIVHPPLRSAQLHSELAKIYQSLPGNQVSIFAACKKDKPGFRASDQTEAAVRHRKSKPSNYSMAAVRICKMLRTCAYNLGMFVYKSK